VDDPNLKRWDSQVIQDLLAQYGIDGSRKPDMKELPFVQIDEFYPMNAAQHNSFNYYVREFYIKALALTCQGALDRCDIARPAQGITMETAFLKAKSIFRSDFGR